MQRLCAVGLHVAGRQAELAAELGGLPVVLGEQRDDLLDALPGAGLDEARDLEVLLRPHGLRQHLVGGVADQGVLERELGLAGERAALAGDDDVLLAQRPQRLRQIAALGFGDGRQRALPERPADHRGVREQTALEGLERVQARREQGLHGRRAARRRSRPPPLTGGAPSPRRTAGCPPRERPRRLPRSR